MKNIWLSTANEHKRKEFISLLEPLGIRVHTPHELPDFPEVEEVGQTFSENAIAKAKALYSVVKAPVIADDSGLVVPALRGAPGIYSARYAGEHATDAENRQLLLRNMSGINQRDAQFVCVLALCTTDDSIATFKGEASGMILKAEQGDRGFGYDSLFFSPELGKTFAEATSGERNRVSHRARALRKLLSAIKEQNRKEPVG